MEQLLCRLVLVSAAAQELEASQLAAQLLEASQLHGQVAAAQLAYVLATRHSGIALEDYGGFQQLSFLVVRSLHFDPALASEVWLADAETASGEQPPPQGAEVSQQLGASQ